MKDILCLLINITQYEIVLHKYMRLHLLHIYLESKIREKSQAGRSKELHFLQCTELSSYGHIKHKCFQKKHSVFTRKLAIHTVEYCQWRNVNSSNRRYLKDSKTILGAGDGTMGFIIILFLYVIEILQNKSIKMVS